MAGAERNMEPALRAGERAQITVRGRDQEIATAIVGALRDDPELTAAMVPTPAGLEVGGNEFGDVSVVQDFIVGAAAGLTADGLLALVRAALGRNAAEKQNPLKETGLNITVKADSPGIVEIEITTFEHRT